MNESGFTASIHGKLDRDRFFIWKINDRSTGGIPDAFYAGENGNTLWIEYKYIEEPGPTIPIHRMLTTKQKAKLRKLQKLGHKAHVILGINKGYFIFIQTGEYDIPLTSYENRIRPKAELIEWINEVLTCSS